MKFRIVGANQSLVRTPGDDFDAGKNLPGALEQVGERQRKIHHCSEYRGSKYRRSLYPAAVYGISGCGVARAAAHGFTSSLSPGRKRSGGRVFREFLLPPPLLRWF